LSTNAYPVFYSFRRCPYAMRARMALYYAGIQCEVREVDLKDKPQALRDISAKATVPTLHLPDGRVIDESLDMMHWALKQSDPAGWLQHDSETMKLLIDQNDSHFKHHLDSYKYPQRYGEACDRDAHFRHACDFLAELEQRLIRSAFLFGDAVSVADVALFPFVRQFAAVDRPAFEALPMAHLQQWLSGWVDDERFLAIMVKRKAWHADDVVSLLLP